MTTTKKPSYDELRRLFVEGVERTLVKAQAQVKEDLPTHLSFLLAVSSEPYTYDDIDGVLARLCPSGAFPRIVDLAVCGVRGNETVIWVCPSALPLTTDLDQTWNQPAGAGPFKAQGLALPAQLWDKEQPFRLSDLAEALSCIGVESSEP